MGKLEVHFNVSFQGVFISNEKGKKLSSRVRLSLELFGSDKGFNYFHTLRLHSLAENLGFLSSMESHSPQSKKVLQSKAFIFDDLVRFPFLSHCSHSFSFSVIII